MDLKQRKAFVFNKWIDKLYAYQYISGIKYESSVLEIGKPYTRELIIAKNWPHYISDDYIPYSELSAEKFNVWGDKLEEVAVYNGLAWRMMQELGLECYGIPCYYRNEAADLLNKDFDLSCWEYDVEAYDPNVIRDNGFVSACSLISVDPRPSNWKRLQKDQAGLFHIANFEELVKLQAATLGDATSEISLFGIRQSRKEALLEALQSREQPDLSKILEPSELFIDILLGIDMFYYDSLLIKSATEISDQLDSLVSEYQQSILNYEAQVDSIQDVDTLLGVLDLLSVGRL